MHFSDEELFRFENTPKHLNSGDIAFLYNDPGLMTGLFRAVVDENIEKVKNLVESGKSVNINDNNGNTPLHVAVIKNNIEILKYLLSQDGIIVNVRNSEGETPLFYAVRVNRVELVKKLIEAGANVNLPNYEDVTPLHVSVTHPDIAHILILHGANIDAIDGSGDRPLHDAVAEECLETVSMLLYYNADANAPGGSTLTPFMKALISEDIKIQEILFDYVDDFNISSYRQHMRILIMALRHNTPYIEEIIKRGPVIYADDIGETEELFIYSLLIPNHNNFKLIWEKIQYREIKSFHLYKLFVNLDENDDLEKYIQVIIDSDNIEPAVGSFTANGEFYLFIDRFAEYKLELEQLTKLTCRLLQYGYRTTSYDICTIFSHYGYCELLRILLYMDNDKYVWYPSMLMPGLIFNVNWTSPSNNVQYIENIHIKDVLQLLEYFIYPPLISALIHAHQGDEYMLEMLNCAPKIPSLTELARNMCRHHIVKSFNITTACQLYTIINHMNIPSAHKKILCFEKKLYDINPPVGARHLLDRSYIHC